MLTVATVADRSGRYYAADLASEPGVVGQRHTGRWLAGAAHDLGMTGAVAPEDLSTVLEGRDPRRDRHLTSKMGTVAAYDLVYSAPKSVSACFALGDDDTRNAIRRAHQVAVEASMGYVGRHVLSVRRRAGAERHPQAVEGPLAAAFDHVASRSLDPHLHTHVVLANIGHGVDGRWSALDGRPVFLHAHAAGALYEAALRRELGQALGIRWQFRPDDGIELAGVPAELRGAFSGRSAEIRAQAFDHGSGSAAARRVAWAATRDPKPGGVSAEDLDLLWRARAASVGIGPAEIMALTVGAQVPAPRRHDVAAEPRDRSGSLDERRFARLLLTGGSGVTRRDVVAAWSGSALAGEQVGAIDRAVERWVPTAGIGVWEPKVAPSEALAPRAAVAALGPRPSGVHGQDVWRATASEIDRYVARYSSVGRGAPAGPLSPATMARMPAGQLAQYLSLQRTVRHARQELGRDHQRPMERRSLALWR